MHYSSLIIIFIMLTQSNCPFLYHLIIDHDYAVYDIEKKGKSIAYYKNYIKILTF